jgi:microcystin-dependent protein
MEPFIGMITMFAGNFAPRGWAYCAGQTLAISQNPALFSILGTTYGGNGQTTFQLPNLMGRVPVGAGQGPGLPFVTLGEQSGTPTITLNLQQLPQHTHPTIASTSAGTLQAPATGAFLAQSNQRDAQYVEASGVGTTVPLGGSSIAGGSQPISIMQPYLGINFIIALEGIFPSRN